MKMIPFQSFLQERHCVQFVQMLMLWLYMTQSVH